jgi:glycosyltransferase involved in cell wall biosynthesis
VGLLGDDRRPAVSVALSMLTLVPGGMGGSETYARELIRELAAGPLDVRTLVSPAGVGFSSDLPEQVAPEFSTGASSAGRAKALVLAPFRRGRLRARLAGADVVHYPFTVPVPTLPRSSAWVVSLLDVQHRDLPELFTRVERAYRSVAYDRAARHADAVITLSEFSKARIVERLEIDPERVHVAHLGVRTEEFTPHLGDREHMLLYPAKAWPHKNHAVLLSAFDLLRRERPRLQLVLTGARRDELPPRLPEGVQVRGLVPRSELVDLYRRAAVMVFPSRYEGFGLPVVEAMASGCPVVAARAGSLPEVVGEAGLLVDPDDPADVASGVATALDAPGRWQGAGLHRAERFTWRACAAVHEAVYTTLGG